MNAANLSPTCAFMVHRAAALVSIIEDVLPVNRTSARVSRMCDEYEELRRCMSLFKRDGRSLWAIHCAEHNFPEDHTAKTVMTGE